MNKLKVFTTIQDNIKGENKQINKQKKPLATCNQKKKKKKKKNPTMHYYNSNHNVSMSFSEPPLLKSASSYISNLIHLSACGLFSILFYNASTHITTLKQTTHWKVN